MLKKALFAVLGLAILLTARSVSTADAYGNEFFSVEQACSYGGGVEVRVGWYGGVPTSQWVDVSLLNNNWQQGTFSGISVGAGSSSVVVAGLMPNALYFFRVNQQQPAGWWASTPTFAFRTTGDCAILQAQPTVSVVITGGNNNNSNSNSGGGSSSSGSDSTATPPAITTPTTDNCHPNYYGACLKPNSVDYDCEGRGDGPDYIKGPVYITGNDPYELDRDGDGVGCNESN